MEPLCAGFGFAAGAGGDPVGGSRAGGEERDGSDMGCGGIGVSAAASGGACCGEIDAGVVLIAGVVPVGRVEIGVVVLGAVTGVALRIACGRRCGRACRVGLWAFVLRVSGLPVTGLRATSCEATRRLVEGTARVDTTRLERVAVW